MKENTGNKDTEEKRSESRRVVDRYYSVEFFLKETNYMYQFKLRDLSSNGLCILVNESSAVLKHIKVGDTLEMKYNPSEASDPPESLKTKIMHITKKDDVPFAGHFLVGLLIIKRKKVLE